MTGSAARSASMWNRSFDVSLVVCGGGHRLSNNQVAPATNQGLCDSELSDPNAALAYVNVRLAPHALGRQQGGVAPEKNGPRAVFSVPPNERLIAWVRRRG